MGFKKGRRRWGGAGVELVSLSQEKTTGPSAERDLFLVAARAESPSDRSSAVEGSGMGSAVTSPSTRSPIGFAAAAPL